MRLPIPIVCWLATINWLAAAGGAVAQTPNVTGITITNAGTYTGDSVSAPARSGQESPTGTIGTDTNWRFVSDSHDVLGKVGTQFGMEFRIDGAPPGEAVTLYLAITFPAPGIRNPNTGALMTSAKIAFPNMKVGSRCVVGYGFENDWEIVPGLWILQVWYQDQMLSGQNFTVGKVE
jgi:hypothetical protein